jgi:hypothetical protein
MSRYHVDNRTAGTQQAITTTAKTQIVLAAIATVQVCRGRVVALAYGPDSVPNATDCNIVYQVQRQSAIGSGAGSAATATLIDPGDAVSKSSAIVNYTVEGTYAGPIFTRALNQRASQQWAAQDNDAMLRWAATAALGLTMTALSPTFTTAVFFGADFED